ncbi:MAG: glycoside hydrolase family 3 C-terminal domain-containing protein [Kiritimatiellae bacterium]|nr:glycoside hydrolase family 3 C-terminal domain-containing protein [Kiritimatiellia bacterium]
MNAIKMVGLVAAFGLAALCTPAGAADAASPELQKDTVEKHAAVSRRAAAEGLILLKNSGALPLEVGSKVALFGATGDYLPGGGGSSNVKAIRIVDIPAGLEEAGFSIDPDSRETALWVITRKSAEGKDCSAKLYNFTDEEKATLAKIKAAGFKKIVAVFNCGHAMNLKMLAEDPAIDAILWAWYPGGEGGAAIADVIKGAVNPSGRLASTFTESNADWPCDRPGDGGNWYSSRYYVPYEEDIFVGYRYFETIPGAKAKVVYPFGYGLSYTTFAAKPGKCVVDETKVSLSVSVTNTGKAAGRYSVLCYTSQEGGKAEHPALELRAFAKTHLLNPGESEELVLSFAKEDLAYFDDEGASGKPGSWVIDSGKYTVWAGGSVRDVVQAGEFAFPVQKILSTPGLKLQSSVLARRLRADGSMAASPITYPGARKVSDSSKPRKTPLAKPEVTLYDVAAGRATLDALLDQMTFEETIHLLYGHPRRDPSGTGSIGDSAKFGVSAAQTCDGPAGVRRSIPSSYFPCAALLAGTFDTGLLEEIGAVIGAEAAEADFDILLAPGLCIHRHPLCGRNFEYFSEDPFVSGVSAAAYVKGVQSQGVGATIKHFAGNNREMTRKIEMDIVSERAFREIYLRGFERAVKDADPWGIMTSYNAENGFNSSVNHGLLTGILRDEWGYKGITMTDWRTVEPIWKEVPAGNDVKMPGLLNTCQSDKAGFTDELLIAEALSALDRNYLGYGQMRTSAKRVLEFVMKTRRFKKEMAGRE